MPQFSTRPQLFTTIAQEFNAVITSQLWVSVHKKELISNNHSFEMHDALATGQKCWKRCHGE